MPTIRKEGKDTIVFATREDHSTPSTEKLPEPEPSPGLILPNGELNWNCPCLGGMATGPCGVEFREAFSCFHYSTTEQKGSDCYEAFKTMQVCMSEYPALYGNKDTEMEEMEQQELSSISQNETEKNHESSESNISNIQHEKSAENESQIKRV